MEDLVERLKEWKTTSVGIALLIVQVANDMGYRLTISIDDLSKYITYIIAAGFLLSGGTRGKAKSPEVEKNG